MISAKSWFNIMPNVIQIMKIWRVSRMG